MRVFWRVFCGLQVLRDQYGVEMLGMCVKKVGRRTGFAIIYVERLVMGMTHCFGTIYGSRKSVSSLYFLDHTPSHYKRLCWLGN